MRILFLSNFYPPFARGGYEQWCQEVATACSKRGHEVGVLTSRPPKGISHWNGDDILIHRLLYLEVKGGLLQTTIQMLKDRKKLERENQDITRQIIEDFQPDLAFVWGMWNIPKSVPALVERLLPGRVVYYLCDYWLSLPSAYEQLWQTPSTRQFVRGFKELLSRYFLRQLAQETPPRLDLAYPVCVSHAVRDLLVKTGVPVQHAQVIYGGTQVEEFAVTGLSRKIRQDGTPLKLLYAGRISVEKGVFTAARAMRLIADQYDSNITLDIVGGGNPNYISKLKKFIADRNIDRLIFLRSPVARCEMPSVLAQYDALVFPSEWEEPFARIILEAMASGLVVIGTTTGGTKEILVEGQTGLTFPAGDVQVLRSQIERLYADPQLGLHLVENSRKLVRDRFKFTHMVDQLDSALQNISTKT